MKKPGRRTIVRLSISAVLALAAVVLFVLNRISEPRSPEELQRDFAASVQAIDREVDIVLDRFGIEKGWVQRKLITGTQSTFIRVERRVLIPPHVVPAMLNRELSALARRFAGKTVATENLKENIVTIHILLRESVIQTVIVKPHPDIQGNSIREERKET